MTRLARVGRHVSWPVAIAALLAGLGLAIGLQMIK
jgi:hypothetical protein